MPKPASTKLKTCGKKGHSKCPGRPKTFKGFIETPELIEVPGTDLVRSFRSGVKGLPYKFLVAGRLHRQLDKAIITAMRGPNEFGVVSSSELEGEPFQLKSLEELVSLLERNPNRTYFVEQPRNNELMSLAAVCNKSY